MLLLFRQSIAEQQAELDWLQPGSVAIQDSAKHQYLQLHQAKYSALEQPLEYLKLVLACLELGLKCSASVPDIRRWSWAWSIRFGRGYLVVRSIWNAFNRRRGFGQVQRSLFDVRTTHTIAFTQLRYCIIGIDIRISRQETDRTIKGVDIFERIFLVCSPRLERRGKSSLVRYRYMTR